MATQTGSIDMKGQKAAADIGLEVDQHFWYDSTGAHVTEVTQEEFTDPSDPSYHSGGNTLMTSTDVKIRDGVTDLATFGASGAVVGENSSGKSRTEIGTGGMQIIQNVSGSDTAIANLGYGPGTDIVGGTSDAPYYTLGTRSGTVGNYSVAEGTNTIASKMCSHAEGNETEATGNYAHAEGTKVFFSGGDAVLSSAVIASGNVSHAEGGATQATGWYSHAEGLATMADGYAAHSQNFATKAMSAYQTAIGKFNTADSADIYAVIIGNGTADNARSDALEVDWAGDVFLALDTSAASGTDHDLYAAITALSWESDVIV